MMTPTAIGLTLLLTFAACQQKESASNTATPAAPAQQQVAATAQLTPEQLGELGGLIKANPDRADQLLAQHNMTRESFEKAVRQVTESVDASRRYTAAYKKTAA